MYRPGHACNDLAAHTAASHPASPCARPRPRCLARRLGATTTELVVAATLLVSAIGTVVPLAVSAGRIQRDVRQYRLALDELSNQLDRLSSLEATERDDALAELNPSPEISHVLIGATLRGELLRDEDGTRLALTLDWDRPTGAVPLRLVGWLDTLPAEQADTASDQSDGEPPSKELSSETETKE